MIIAHRGASAYAPENTMASVRKAFEMGADGIEIDVQMSSDGEVFVFHDWDLKRIAGEPYLITERKSSDIRRLDAGRWFSEKYEGEKIPTLEEILSIVPPGKLINIEVKRTAFDRRDLEGKVLGIIRDSAHYPDIVISSFNFQTIARVEKQDRNVKTALISNSMFEDPMRYFSAFRCYSYHPLFYYVDRDLLALMHSHNIKVYAWTVDVPDYAKTLTEMGCDGIITNNPALAF